MQAEGIWGFCVLLAEYKFYFPPPPAPFFQASCKHTVGQQSWEELLSLNAAQVPLTFSNLARAAALRRPQAMNS